MTSLLSIESLANEIEMTFPNGIKSAGQAIRLRDILTTHHKGLIEAAREKSITTMELDALGSQESDRIIFLSDLQNIIKE